MLCWDREAEARAEAIRQAEQAAYDQRAAEAEARAEAIQARMMAGAQLVKNAPSPLVEDGAPRARPVARVGPGRSYPSQRAA